MNESMWKFYCTVSVLKTPFSFFLHRRNISAPVVCFIMKTIFWCILSPNIKLKTDHFCLKKLACYLCRYYLGISVCICVYDQSAINQVIHITFFRKHKMICCFCHFFNIKIPWVFKILPNGRQVPVDTTCWWPVDRQSQGISNHHIDLVSLECYSLSTGRLNTLRLRQNGHHFVDHVFKCIFLNENVWVSHKISFKFGHKVPIDNIPAVILYNFIYHLSHFKPDYGPTNSGIFKNAS